MGKCEYSTWVEGICKCGCDSTPGFKESCNEMHNDKTCYSTEGTYQGQDRNIYLRYQIHYSYKFI